MFIWILLMGIDCFAGPPIVFIPKTCQAFSAGEKQRIADSVKRYFCSDTDDSPYSSIKIKCLASKDTFHGMTVYLLYRDKYLFETYKLILDNRFRIVEGQKLRDE